MQVLQEQDQRCAHGQRPECIAQFAEHALLGGADGLAEQLLMNPARGEGPRQLQAPGGGVDPEHAEDSLSMGALQQGAEGIEPGQVGLAGAVQLHAAPAGGDETRIAPARAAEEGVGQGRLADPRLAGEEDDLAGTSAGPLQGLREPLQLRFPADEGLGLARSGRRGDVQAARGG